MLRNQGGYMNFSSHIRLLELVKDRYTNGRFILGLDGLSRSGKSTLAKSLSELLTQSNYNVMIFHIDDHIVERKRRYDTGFDEWYEYYHLQWDADYLREHLFARLRTENKITLPYYQNDLDEMEIRTKLIPQECIVIIEGVFLQREQWRSLFDLMVYLDCPREERFERESLETQGKIEKFKSRYWKAEEYYSNKICPVISADIVIDS
jgi:uridine kinase